MYTITLDELTFSSPFSLYCRRNDYIQAFVTYFTIDFTKCHKPTGFSTGLFCSCHSLSWSCVDSNWLSSSGCRLCSVDSAVILPVLWLLHGWCFTTSTHIYIYVWFSLLPVFWAVFWEVLGPYFLQARGPIHERSQTDVARATIAYPFCDVARYSRNKSLVRQSQIWSQTMP